MPAFLFEVGTEELPASFVASAVRQWRDRVPTSLAEANLSAASVQVFATPRRLAVLIDGLPDRQPDRTEEVKGPPASAAFR
ncbi:MAG TPA: glycine--tRNA ligase subunit beta, partial [Coleofasciculaceae cyanobacterium]